MEKRGAPAGSHPYHGCNWRRHGEQEGFPGLGGWGAGALQTRRRPVAAHSLRPGMKIEGLYFLGEVKGEVVCAARGGRGAEAGREWRRPESAAEGNVNAADRDKDRTAGSAASPAGGGP